jgi:hypothetical protein
MTWERATTVWLNETRQREVQALGAAISRRNWHDAEQAYNQLRDKIDFMLIEERRKDAPLPEHEDWQLTER